MFESIYFFFTDICFVRNVIANKTYINVQITLYVYILYYFMNSFFFFMALSIWYYLYWQTLSRSPKSKFKSRLTTGFSLKSDFPTSHPAGKVSKKQDTAIYPKQKLLIYIRKVSKMFWNKPRPKTHPQGAKKGQKTLNQRLLQPC